MRGVRVFTSMRIGVGLRLSLLFTSFSGCSVLYDLSPDQCEVNADCAALGGEFEKRVCVAGVCVQPAGTSGSGGTRGGSDSGGSDSGGSGGDDAAGEAGQGGAPIEPPECTTHAECLEKSGKFKPRVCIEQACVDLLTPDCPLALPQTDDLWFDNLLRENPLIVGAYSFVPTELVGIATRNYDLALTEVTRKTNGVPGADGARRQVVGVVCRSNYAAPEDLDASAEHLIDDLRVPGVISALLADDLQRTFETFGEPAGTFFVSPIEADSTLVALQDRDLLWHMLPGGQDVAVSYAALLDRAIAFLGSPEPVKVAVVTASDVRYLSDMNGTVLKTIRFNGKSAAANASDDNFLALNITSAYSDPSADLSSAVQALRNFEPNVIIALSADETLKTLIPLLESSWTGATKPFYLFSPYHYNNPELGDLLSNKEPTVRQRMAGINFASAVDGSLNESYQLAFDQAYPEVAGRRGYENFYDATYYLLYALAAAPSDAPPTGDGLALGMKRLLAGDAFGVGKDDLPGAFSALSGDAETTISLNGTLGPPDFDPATGGRVSPGSVWCVDASGNQRIDVLRYDPEGNLLTGTFPCFSGF